VSLEVGSLGSLREHNRRRVVDALRVHGLASRADLARLTGLSRTTVSSLVAELQTQGLVVERAEDERADGDHRSGRPGIPLALDESAGVVVGLQFDQSGIRVAVADLARTVLAERRVALDVDNAGASALDAGVALADAALAEAGHDLADALAIGVALPGPVNHRRDLVHAGAVPPSWVGLSPATELRARLGIPVHVDNDANLGALAEARFGAAADHQDLVYVMASAGIGAGLVVGGRLHRGAGGTAGELGHVLVDEHGAFCRCGSRGCLETVVGAPAIVEALRPTHGPDLTLDRVIELALAGQPAPQRALADAGNVLGRAIAGVCDVLNPALVVVGGDLARAGELLLGPVREAIDRDAMRPAADAVEVRPSALPGRAEVLGALVLAADAAEVPDLSPTS
jgi:predicted NBD/HSP70 family sugar kinase